MGSKVRAKAFIGTLIGSILMGVLALGLPSATAMSAPVDPTEDYPRLPATCIGPGQQIPQHAGPCYLTPYDPDRRTVVLWGDSHAWMYIPPLQKLAEGRHVNLVAFVMGACPPILVNSHTPKAPHSIRCRRQSVAAMAFLQEQLADHHPTRVILAANWTGYIEVYRQTRLDWILPLSGYDPFVAERAEMFHASTGPLFAALGDQGIQVDVVAQTATVPTYPGPCSAGTEPYACDVLRFRAIPEESSTRDWLKSKMQGLDAGARYIDVNGEICSSSNCHGRIHGIYTFFNDLHLSTTRALRMSRFFAPTFSLLAQQPR